MKLAAAVIQNSLGQLLLIHRRTRSLTQWEIPGGKVETGERDIDAAYRELAEELGIEIEISRRLGKAKFKEGERALECVWYGAQVKRGTPRIRECHLHDDLRFFDLSELFARSDISSNLRNLLKAVARLGLGQVPITFWEDAA